jgi:hypothetical protein
MTLELLYSTNRTVIFLTSNIFHYLFKDTFCQSESAAKTVWFGPLHWKQYCDWKGLWNNFAQMFVITRWCVMHNNQTPTSRVKVALAHLRSTLSIWGYMSCPVHNFLIFKGILSTLATIVHNNETMCHAQQPVTYLQGQGHPWRSKINIVCYRVYFVFNL